MCQGRVGLGRRPLSQRTPEETGECWPVLSSVCVCAHSCVCVCVSVFGDCQRQGQECALPGMKKVKKSRIKDVWSSGQSRPWELEGGCSVRVQAGGSELQTEWTRRPLRPGFVLVEKCLPWPGKSPCSWGFH